ncbi:hypothetical protein KM043_003516 [Ampulex compressa]|nr:hypothetical protein KM043_003516 [Ampulex compressa]
MHLLTPKQPEINSQNKPALPQEASPESRAKKGQRFSTHPLATPASRPRCSPSGSKALISKRNPSPRKQGALPWKHVQPYADTIDERG